LDGAVWSAHAWNTQDVVSNVPLEIYGHNVNWVNVGFLALDSHDYPKISYFATHLMYASWTGNTWNIQTIDTNAEAKPGFLALDSNGNPHISYLGPLSPNVYLYRRYADVMYATSTEIAVEVPFATALVVAVSVATVAVVGAGLLVYFKKRKR
jgi:hypothetical protein